MLALLHLNQIFYKIHKKIQVFLKMFFYKKSTDLLIYINGCVNNLKITEITDNIRTT
jgi:hypothetical protein